MQDWKVRCPCGLEGIGEDDGSEMVAAPLSAASSHVSEEALNLSKYILEWKTGCECARTKGP